MQVLHGIKILGFIAMIVVFVSCRPPAPLETSINDQPVSILLPSGDKANAEVIYDVIERVESRVDALDTHEGSVLGALNSSEVGEIIEMGDVSGILTDCFEYSEQCYGAFDPTLQILWDVYDFELGGRYVSDSELEEALLLVDSGFIEITDDGILRKEEDVRMGFGPTIGGAIVDLMVEEMDSVDLEWEVLSVGENMAVRKETVYDFFYPFDERTDEPSMYLLGHVRLQPGEFLSVLDQDVNYFFSHGDYFHQVVDPIYGKPVDEVRAAVVVTGESGLQASIFAYAVMVMGEERGIEFLNETDGVAGLVLLDDARVVVSGGLEERFWR